eukprot:COSAG02_NODE_4226_length_5610_cov_5.981673_3_plen_50_part_00
MSRSDLTEGSRLHEAFTDYILERELQPREEGKDRIPLFWGGWISLVLAS